jgi:H+/gluconate symporter-like permease
MAKIIRVMVAEDFPLLREDFCDVVSAQSDMEVVGSAASVGLDSLPHNGAVITLLTICGQSHKESYKYIFFPTVVFTLAGMFLSIALGTVLYPIS